MDTEDCGSGETCVYSYVNTAKKDIYERRCGKSNYCQNLKEKYRMSLETCEDCDDDLCNNEAMKFTI